MVAQRKIRCAVVAVTADQNGMIANPTLLADGELTPRPRPSDLLPWADPYIAGLVRKLQAEVRTERGSATNRVAGLLTSEAEVPWTGENFDQPSEDDAPSIDGDRWGEFVR